MASPVVPGMTGSGWLGGLTVEGWAACGKRLVLSEGGVPLRGSAAPCRSLPGIVAAVRLLWLLQPCVDLLAQRVQCASYPHGDVRPGACRGRRPIAGGN